MHPVLFHFGSIVIPSYGVIAALGVVLALTLATRLARVARVDANQVWNLCVIALFAAVAGSRVLLVAVNWSVLRLHPRWLLGLAMIHHPLLAAVGAVTGMAAAFAYGSRQKLPLWNMADTLAAPLALGLAFEQAGALLAGAGYGTPTELPWAVTYTYPLAARWSGTPLGLSLHPVQGYAALAFLTLALLLSFWLPRRHRVGDVTGVALLGMSIAVFITEIWRDSEGRGALLGGALDGPQVVAMLMAAAGAAALWQWKPRQLPSASSKDEPSKGSGFESVNAANPPLNDEAAHE